MLLSERVCHALSYVGLLWTTVCQVMIYITVAPEKCHAPSHLGVALDNSVPCTYYVSDAEDSSVPCTYYVSDAEDNSVPCTYYVSDAEDNSLPCTVLRQCR
jgi:hypothetical protein